MRTLRLKAANRLDHGLKRNLLLAIYVKKAQLRQLLTILSGITRIKLFVLILRMFIAGAVAAVEFLTNFKILQRLQLRVVMLRQRPLGGHRINFLELRMQQISEKLVNTKQHLIFIPFIKVL